MILERQALPFELTPERVRRICGRTSASLGRRPSALRARARLVARLRIFNPDGSEAELSGNGARQAVLYLRPEGWTDQDEFVIEAAAGRITADDHGRARCAVEMGRRARLGRLTRRADGRRARSRAAAGACLPARAIGNPQCAIEAGAEASRTLDLGRYGPPIERHELFPNRTNVAFWRRDDDPRRDRAHLRARGGGDPLVRHGGRGGRRGGRPGGARTPVAVASTAASSRLMSPTTSTSRSPAGPVPVYEGELSDELVQELERPGRPASQRLERIPPYLFAELERKIAEKRAQPAST